MLLNLSCAFDTVLSHRDKYVWVYQDQISGQKLYHLYWELGYLLNVFNLSMIFDPSFWFDAHVKQLNKTSASWDLLACSIRDTRWCFYLCSGALFSSLSIAALDNQQTIQNAATGLLTGSNRCFYMSPSLKPQDWLPVTHRGKFKTLTPTYRALQNQGPA